MLRENYLNNLEIIKESYNELLFDEWPIFYIDKMERKSE